MSYFPFFIDLKDTSGLIVGGGMVALRKAERLLPYGPRLTVIAPEVLPALEQMPVQLVRRCFQPEDITLAGNWSFVIAASDDAALNRTVAGLCRAKNILVNVVDVRDECTFVFPCLIQRGKLSIGISSSGASPSAAVYLKEQIQQLLPENIEELLDFLEAQREQVRRQIPTEPQRAALYRTMLEQCLNKRRILTEEEVHTLMEESRNVLCWEGLRN